MRICKILLAAPMALLLLPPSSVASKTLNQPWRTFSEECYPEDVLLCAIGQHDNTKVKELLEQGTSASALGFRRGYEGDRPEFVAEFNRETYPLEFAIQYRNFLAVDQLLAHGADPNFEPKNGITPLGTAVSFGELGIVQLLLARGADPNKLSSSPDGYPPILAAADGPDGDHIEGARSSNIQSRIVDALVEAGADVNATAGKVDALDRAAFAADPKLLNRLLELGAKPACLTEDFDNFNTDWTLIQWSVKSRDPKTVQAVVSLAPYYCVGSAKGGLLAVRDEAKEAKNYKEGYSEAMEKLARIKVIINRMAAHKQQ